MEAKRRQVIEMRKALSCQAKQACHDLIAGLNDEMAALFDAQIATLEKVIDRVIEADADLARKRKLLRSIPGIGSVSAFTMIGDMPGLGSLTAGAAAALAGLAPFARDSGTITSPRFIAGGRSVVRDVLYMAAVRASTLEDSLKPFASRLKARHKPGKQVIIAFVGKTVSQTVF